MNNSFEPEFTVDGKTHRWTGTTWEISVVGATTAKPPQVTSIAPIASNDTRAIKDINLLLTFIRELASKWMNQLRKFARPDLLIQKLMSWVRGLLIQGAKLFALIQKSLSHMIRRLSAATWPSALLQSLITWARAVPLNVAKFFALLQKSLSHMIRRLSNIAWPSALLQMLIAWARAVPLGVAKLFALIRKSISQMMHRPSAPALPFAPALPSASALPSAASMPSYSIPESRTQVRSVLLDLAKFFALLKNSISRMMQKLAASAKPSAVKQELGPRSKSQLPDLAAYLSKVEKFFSSLMAWQSALAKSSPLIQKAVSRFKNSPTPNDPQPEIRNGETLRTLKSRSTRVDTIFRAVATSSGGLTVGVMLAVGLFLGFRALTAIDVAGLSFLTEQSWSPETQTFGVAAVLFGTVTIALIALSISVPLSIGTALLISMVVSERVRRFLISLVDLMAAVPSVIFGLWGVFFLQENIIPVSRWISSTFGWIPIFSVTNDAGETLSDASAFTSSAFIAGIVVSLMVVPTQTSIMREAFMQTPIGEREGALALGATRWSMITTVVLPFGKGGMIGGTMLGLGRALGETIAVYMIISPVFVINWQLLKTGTNSVSSLIALRYGEASEFGISALMAAGLVLFLITLVINFAASTIVARSRSGAEG